jgi:TRAP-type mannitol/chloroaromatic compound transport system permease small subunit
MVDPERPESPARPDRPSQAEALKQVIHHAELPRTALSNALDAFIRRIGEVVSWVWVLLVAVIMLNVTMRYVLGEGRIEFEEIQWHLYSVGFLIGLSYCLEADDHIRVDLLHERFSLRAKAWFELFGILFFLSPFIAVVTIFTAPFVEYSFEVGEISEAPGGLPLRWLIKSVLLVGFVLLTVATLSRLSRVTACLFAFPRPRPVPSAK